jgi:hypothetical protein
MKGSTKERFDAKWMPEPYSGCWLWTAGTTKNPTHKYGTFFIGGGNVPAHRVSWTLHRGKIPDEMKVLHKCDTPLCVNPDHLFLGTQLENVMDSVRKRRHEPRKFSDEDIKAIRQDTRLQRIIAADYGVSRSMITMIKLNQYWKHVT